MKKAIDDAAAGRASLPDVTGTCPDCKRAFQRALRPPRSHFQALEEQTLATGHRVDVLVFVGGEPELAVEIEVSNPVDATKAKTLPIRWLQLAASDLIKEPMLWKVTDGSFLCDPCEAVAKTQRPSYRAIKTSLRDSTPSGAPVVPKGFTCTPARCWKENCRRVIPIFDWVKDESGAPVHKPRPDQVQHRHVLSSNSYCYVNVCPWCETIQGPSKVVQNSIDYAKELIAKPPKKVEERPPRERTGSV